MQRLPVFTTVSDAYRFLWVNRRDFLALSFLMILVNALMDVMVQAGLPADFVYSPEAVAALLEGPAIFVILLASVIGMALYAMFAIAWHRRYLVGAESTTVGGAIRWRSRHWRYVSRFILLIIIGSLAFNVLVTAMLLVVPVLAGSPENLSQSDAQAIQMIGVVAVLVLMLFVSRFLLAFPAAAVDDFGTGFRGSWRLSKGNTNALFLVLLLTGAPALVASVGIGFLLTTAIGPTAVLGSLSLQFLVSLIVQLLRFVGIALTTSVLSIAYQDLKAMSNSAQSGT